METSVATHADAIVEAGVILPESLPTQPHQPPSPPWSELSKSAATPFQGLGLYELFEIREVPPTGRYIETAGANERSYDGGPVLSSVN